MRITRIFGAVLPLLIASGSLVANAQGRGQDKQEQKREDKDQKGRGNRPVPQQEQQQRAKQEQDRARQYRQTMDNQVRVAQERAAQLQQQNRVAQARAQEQYAAQLRQQQERSRTDRDYSRDPYVTAPHNYRYVVAGNSRQTNQYGADVLRHAVDNGYGQGFRAGQADREDRRRSAYQQSFGYMDANFGYEGNYVAQSDYNYYFRQGFRRGYQDGYNRRTQYGSSSNGSPVILAAIAATILGLVILNR